MKIYDQGVGEPCSMLLWLEEREAGVMVLDGWSELPDD
jgi:hypothetical protein